MVIRHWKVLVGFLALLGFPAFAETPISEAQRAKELLQRAVDHYRSEGEGALAAFSRQGPYLENDLYVFVVDRDGVMLASSGPSHALIGRNVRPLLDDSLRAGFDSVVAEAGEGMREGEYRWMNWRTGRVERKRAFYQPVGDRILAVGYYLGGPGEEEAKALLSRVVEGVQENRHSTLNAINWLDSRYLQDELYAFVIDTETEKFVAHGYDTDLIGKDFASLVDRTGKAIGQDMLRLIDEQDEAEYSYQWRNPVTGKYELKRAYLRRVGNLLIAVGYYSDLAS